MTIVIDYIAHQLMIHTNWNNHNTETEKHLISAWALAPLAEHVVGSRLGERASIAGYSACPRGAGAGSERESARWRKFGKNGRSSKPETLSIEAHDKRGK